MLQFTADGRDPSIKTPDQAAISSNPTFRRCRARWLLCGKGTELSYPTRTMRSKSPRLTLRFALLALLALPACGDSSDGETGTTAGGTDGGTATTSSEETSGATSSKSGSESSNTSDKSTTQSNTSPTTAPTTGTITDSTNSSSSTKSDSTEKGSSTSDTTSDSSSSTSAPEKITLTKHVQPIFNASCGCHTKSNAAAGLNLSTGVAFASLKDKSGSNGSPYITPKDVSKSYIYGVMTHELTVKMPGSKLPDDKLKIVRDWINDGALE